jgi:isocitrate dehydrogenase
MKIKKPVSANPITITNSGKIDVPNHPIIPFIEGDGIGSDITPVMQAVINAAIAKAYQNTKKIAWMEIYAGEKSTKIYGKNDYLTEETLNVLRE